MRKHLAATLLIAVAIGPAPALALDLSTKVGPVGVSANLGISNSGASAGVGADADGVGGVKGGTSLGGNGGSSLGVGGNLGGKSGGVSVGSGSKTGSSGGAGTTAGSGANSGGSAAGSGSGTRSSGGAFGGSTAQSPRGGGAKAIAPIAPVKSARASIVLPRILWPLKKKRAQYERGEWAYPLRTLSAIVAVPGTPSPVVRACRQAIASAASPLGAVRVRAASAGSLIRHRSGAFTAPLTVSIDYADQDGIQVRQARIRCRLDASRRVIAVI